MPAGAAAGPNPDAVRDRRGSKAEYEVGSPARRRREAKKKPEEKKGLSARLSELTGGKLDGKTTAAAGAAVVGFVLVGWMLMRKFRGGGSSATATGPSSPFWTLLSWVWWVVWNGGLLAIGGAVGYTRGLSKQRDTDKNSAKERAKEKKEALRVALDAGALPNRMYEDLISKVDRVQYRNQLASTMGDGECECPWLTDLMREMWPGIDNYVKKDIITNWIEPMLQESFSGIKFTKKTLGNAYPKMGPMKSRRTVDSRGIGVEWSIGMRYESNCDIVIQASLARLGSVSVGVSNLSMVGTLLVYLRPMQLEMPFIGGMEMTFLNKPEIELEFKGLGTVAEIPGLRSTVMSLISDSIAASMVLPNRIAFPIDWTGAVDKCLMRNPEPEGVVRVTVLHAKDLQAADMAIFGQATSDPYVEVTVGTATKRTPHIAKNLNPVWEEDNVFDFFVYSREQLVEFMVYDYDQVGSPDELGGIKTMSVRRLIAEGAKEHADVELDNGQGTLTFSVQWIDPLTQGESVNEDGVRSRIDTDQRHHCQRDVTDSSGYRKPDGASPDADSVDKLQCSAELGVQCYACYKLDEPAAHRASSPRLGGGAAGGAAAAAASPRRVVGDRASGCPVTITLSESDGPLQPGAIPKDAVLLSARFGATAKDSRPDVDVSARVLELLRKGDDGAVRASHGILGVDDPCPGKSKTLRLEFLVPTGPNSGMLSFAIEKIEGHTEEADNYYKIKAELEVKSEDKPQVIDSWWGWAPWDGYPDAVAKRLEERIDDELGKKKGPQPDYGGIAQVIGIDEALVKSLLEPGTGVRDRNSAKQKEIDDEKRKKPQNTAKIAELTAEQKKLRTDWETKAAAQRTARMAAAEPQLEQVLHFLLPEDWESLTLTLCDKNGKAEAGLRFPSVKNKGCLGLRHVEHSGTGGVGYYEELDKDGEVTRRVERTTVSRIDGPFKLDVPADKRQPKDLASSFGSGVDVDLDGLRDCVLFGRVSVFTLVPRQPVSYTPTVVLDVIQATNLVALDFATRSSDPFFKVRYRGRDEKTAKVDRCLTPKYNQRFEFHVEQAVDCIDLECWDADVSGQERFMGRCNFNPYTFVYKKRDKKVQEARAQGGEVDEDDFQATVAQFWKKLAPRLGNDRDWQLLQGKGRTVAMGLGRVEVRVTLRGPLPMDFGDVYEPPGAAESTSVAIGSGAASAVAMRGVDVVEEDDDDDDDEVGNQDWEDAGDVTHCKRCNVKFTTFTRKHHCRACGGVFCDTCTGNRITIGPLKDQRACAACAKKAKEQKKHPLYLLLGDEIGAMYGEQLIKTGKTLEELKDTPQKDLHAFLTKTGVHGELHRRVICGKLAQCTQGGPPRDVTVEILSGKGLIVQDTFASDPFVVVTYRGEERQTAVCKRTVNPTWKGDNVFTFPLTGRKDMCGLLCQDWDLQGPPDFMGYVEFCPMDEQFYQPSSPPAPVTVTLPLTTRDGNRDDEATANKKGRKGDHPLGTLTLRVTVRDGGRPDLIEGAGGVLIVTEEPKADAPAGLPPDDEILRLAGKYCAEEQSDEQLKGIAQRTLARVVHGDAQDPLGLDVDSIVRLFVSIDENQDGKITRSELIRKIRRLGVAEVRQNSSEHTAFESFYQQSDADESRGIDCCEFVRSLWSAPEAAGPARATTNTASIAADSLTPSRRVTRTSSPGDEVALPSPTTLRARGADFDITSVSVSCHEERKEATFFAIDVQSSSQPPWRVFRRFSQFYSFRKELEKHSPKAANAAPFPHRSFGSVTGEKLVQRRKDLDEWLGAAHAKASADEAEARGPLVVFLEDGGGGAAEASFLGRSRQGSAGGESSVSRR